MFNVPWKSLYYSHFLGFCYVVTQLLCFPVRRPSGRTTDFFCPIIVRREKTISIARLVSARA